MDLSMQKQNFSHFMVWLKMATKSRLRTNQPKRSKNLERFTNLRVILAPNITDATPQIGTIGTFGTKLEQLEQLEQV